MDKDDLQGNWFRLVDKFDKAPSGATTSEHEAGARKHLATLLRNYADQVESGRNPMVFGYSEEKKDLFWEIKVLLSWPWPG